MSMSLPSIVVVVLVTTAAQIASAMGIAIFPVLAPQLSRMLDIDASAVGYLMSILFGTAMLASGAVGTVVLRWGACRAMQWSLWICAAGMIAGLAGKLWLMPVAAMCSGISTALAAAGAAHLLYRFGPPARRNLIFSIKQTGVPLGWAAIALVAPVLTVAFGWRVSMLVVLAYSVAGALLLGRWREPNGTMTAIPARHHAPTCSPVSACCGVIRCCVTWRWPVSFFPLCNFAWAPSR